MPSSFDSCPGVFRVPLSPHDHRNERLGFPDPLIGGGDARHHIAGIHNEAGPGGELFVIHGIVRGGNQHGVETGKGAAVPFNGFRTGPMGMFAGGPDDGDVGIVVCSLCAAGFQQVKQTVARGFAVVVHVGLVGQAEYEYAGGAQGFLLRGEGGFQALDDAFGHGAVDFAGEFYETRLLPHLFGFPC